MAIFTYTPDRGFECEVEPKVDVVAFGDGYEARSASGINHMKRRYRLSFNNRDTTESQEIFAFLTARAGVESFDWTPPDGTGAGKFVSRRWSKAHSAGVFFNIATEFDEVFES